MVKFSLSFFNPMNLDLVLSIPSKIKRIKYS